MVPLSLIPNALKEFVIAVAFAFQKLPPNKFGANNHSLDIDALVKYLFNFLILGLKFL